MTKKSNLRRTTRPRSVESLGDVTDASRSPNRPARVRTSSTVARRARAAPMRRAAARAVRALASTSREPVAPPRLSTLDAFRSLQVFQRPNFERSSRALWTPEPRRDDRERDGASFVFRGYVASADRGARREEDVDAASTQDDDDDERDEEESAPESKREQMRGEQNFNVPNALCAMRIVAGPVLGVGIAHGASPELVLGGVAFAAVTDYFDGFLARRWKQQTILGSYLDPVADKVFVGCVGTALALDGRLPIWLVSLLIFRDVVHVVGGAWRRAGALGWKWRTTGEFLGFDDKPMNRPPPTGAAALAGFDFDDVEGLGSKRGALRPLFIGKVNTALQMALVAFACAEPVYTAHALDYGLPFAELFSSVSRARGALEYATAASAVVATGEYARIFLSHPGFDARGRLKKRPRGEGAP